MDVIFQPLALNCKSTLVIRMSDELMAELMTIAICGPLAVVNLRAKYAGFLVATAASSSVIAGVRAALPVQVAAEVGRHTLRHDIDVGYGQSCYLLDELFCARMAFWTQMTRSLTRSTAPTRFGK